MSRFRLIWGKLRQWFAVPWYPFAISAYPVFALMATNIGEVGLDAGISPLLVCLLFGGLLFLLFWLFGCEGSSQPPNPTVTGDETLPGLLAVRVTSPTACSVMPSCRALNR